MTRFDPAAYSAATRRAITQISGQLEARERHENSWVETPSQYALARSIEDYSIRLGLAISLVAIAETHRQWGDYEHWSFLQGQFSRRVSDLRQQLTGSPV
jgi:hypothetical protein